MVCKEEILLWFKDLDSFKRIDVIYELLNMCLPFELRFLGSCIEELGKHTYPELRGPAITANDIEKLSKDVSLNQGILDETVRHRVLIYISLLSSRNYSVATWLYRKLLRTEIVEEYIVKDQGKDEMTHSEFLLLFTMALHHPAFTFEQKQFFSRIVMSLNDFRENRVSAKHSALGYPPGFGYPTHKFHDINFPIKGIPTSGGDNPSNFHQQPGLQHIPPFPHYDIFAPIWSKPGFPYGAPPEMPPFPASVSPLVSQTASPNQSRTTSPHRTPVPSVPQPPPITRPPPHSQPPPPPHLQQPTGAPPPVVNGPQPPPPAGDLLPPPPALSLEQHSQSSLQPVFSPPDIKLVDENDTAKLSSMEEKRLRELLWPQPGLINLDVKPNGIRFPPFVGKVRPYLFEHMQAMNLDGENSLHQSNSSSNNSSPVETPPGTPSTTTPATTPHGPGRGDKQPRPNGMPFPANPGGPPLPQDASSVPYSFPQQFAALPPNRSMFHYNQHYRPTFTAHYPTFPTTENFPTYTIPYVPLMYSSHYQQRTPPGCYNCGAPSHIGSECSSQNIEEITQKKTFQLEYDATVPDSDK